VCLLWFCFKKKNELHLADGHTDGCAVETRPEKDKKSTVPFLERVWRPSRCCNPKRLVLLLVFEKKDGNVSIAWMLCTLFFAPFVSRPVCGLLSTTRPLVVMDIFFFKKKHKFHSNRGEVEWHNWG
jgi:hypothetical protein